MKNLVMHYLIVFIFISQVEPIFCSAEDKLTHLENENIAMKDELKDLRNRVLELQRVQTKMVDILEDRDTLGKTIESKTLPNTIGTYMASDAVCSGEEVTLTCTDGKTILVEKAEYAQYYIACDENTCCTPNPYDCVESLQEIDPVEWAVIKTLCDNQTQCTYLFRSSIFLQDCSPGSDVDYLAVYNTCNPGDLGAPIGFTATSPDVDFYCTEYAVVPFQSVLSNFGGFYDNTASIFYCPYDGVYMFFVNVQQLSTLDANVELMIDKSGKGRAVAEDDSSARDSGSAFTITQCNVGQKAWVRCNYGDNHAVRYGARDTTFSGYLLHYL